MQSCFLLLRSLHWFLILIPSPNLASHEHLPFQLHLLLLLSSFVYLLLPVTASLVAQMVKNLCNAGDLGLISGSGRSPAEGNGNPHQYSCLENPHGQSSLVGYSPWSCKESDMTEWLTHTHTHPVKSLPVLAEHPIHSQNLNVFWMLPAYVYHLCLENFFPSYLFASTDQTLHQLFTWDNWVLSFVPYHPLLGLSILTASVHVC